jgi:hypothetical protein
LDHLRRHPHIERAGVELLVPERPRVIMLHFLRH